MTDTPDKRFFNLSEITARVQQILQPHIGKLFWVRAEISSGRERGGSFYCDLVETDEAGKIIAQMRCTIWNRDLANIKKQFKEHDLDLTLDDGTAVGFQCSLQYSPQYGLSLKAVGADPTFALGELELRKKEILDRLVKEGLLEPNKQLFVPLLPQRIGLITSKGSAACNDIIQTLSASDFGFQVLLADSVVQGLQAESSILMALDILEKCNVELVIIARGGGSKTDLFYLDNEAIARRIASYKIPVWTGIGHETDIGILDHVANRHFKTPTAIAEEIVARFVEMKRHIEEAQNRFRSTWSYRHDADRTWLEDAKVGIRQGTRKLLETTRSYLRGYAVQLSSKVQERLSNEKSNLAVSRKMIVAAPTGLIKLNNEHLKDRTVRFASSYKRQIVDKQKDLFKLKKRFLPNRFVQIIRQEKLCLNDWCDRLTQQFRSEFQLHEQNVRHLSNRFRLETIITHLKTEKAKLATKAATLRAADPATSVKRGFSLVYTEDGNLVKSLSQVQLDDVLETEISDGRIFSTVKKTKRKNND